MKIETFVLGNKALTGYKWDLGGNIDMDQVLLAFSFCCVFIVYCMHTSKLLMSTAESSMIKLMKIQTWDNFVLNLFQLYMHTSKLQHPINETSAHKREWKLFFANAFLILMKRKFDASLFQANVVLMVTSGTCFCCVCTPVNFSTLQTKLVLTNCIREWKLFF